MNPVTVKLTATGHSRPLAVDYRQQQISIGLAVVVTGTVNYTVEQTFDDVQDPAVTPVWLSITALAAKTDNEITDIVYAPRYIRLTVNSGTPAFSAALTMIQAG